MTQILSEHRREQCVHMVQQTPFIEHLKAEIGLLAWGQCTLIMPVGPEQRTTPAARLPIAACAINSKFSQH